MTDVLNAETPTRRMLVTAARTAYLGLMGRRATSFMGAATLYTSIGTPLRISQDGAERRCMIALVPPYTAHRVATADRLIAIVQVEAEAACTDSLRQQLVDDGAWLAARIRAAFRRLPDLGDGAAEFDRLFFGEPLPCRHLDPRIAAVVERINADPAARLSAQAGAALAGLSLSRFMHLFTAQTGTTFRRFRAWKRARRLLALVKQPVNMVDAALDSGYADSTHFSHSIRKAYGMQPREMIAGARRLELYARWPAAARL